MVAAPPYHAMTFLRDTELQSPHGQRKTNVFSEAELFMMHHSHPAIPHRS
jgi:hypothetical protein